MATVLSVLYLFLQDKILEYPGTRNGRSAASRVRRPTELRHFIRRQDSNHNRLMTHIRCRWGKETEKARSAFAKGPDSGARRSLPVRGTFVTGSSVHCESLSSPRRFAHRKESAIASSVVLPTAPRPEARMSAIREAASLCSPTESEEFGLEVFAAVCDRLAHPPSPILKEASASLQCAKPKKIGVHTN